jgi:predicted dehydrogenase
MRPLRFGLVGTGHWARIAHAPALHATEGIEFTAIWGRDQRAAGKIAGKYGISPHVDFDEFLGDVDAVAFAVPPDVQSALAIRAASTGKHLLLEKPLALTAADADAVTKAVQDAGVAALVFFTSQFQADVRAWLADVAKAGGWVGGSALWLGSALSQGSPFNTPWRRDKGGLWDLAPHLIALLWTSLGPVTSVTADAGHEDVAHLVLHHSGGASSVITVTLAAPEDAGILEVWLWGPAGRSAAPRESDETVVALRTALTELAECARSGRLDHQCDVRFGRDVTLVIADAYAQITARRSATGPGLD